MYYFPDFLVFFCLFTCGYFFGYYCKFAYIYDNLWTHWYGLLGAAVALVLASLWTLKKYRQRQYNYDHFYIIFYALICFVISCCFMITDNLDICFYFGFIGLSAMFIPCYSYISLRSTSRGWRPARIALANTIYFAGVTTAFSFFNEFEPTSSGWIYLTLTLVMIAGVVLNEVLQHVGLQNYKQSRDLVFNLLNEEKIVFLPNKSIFALFVSRNDFYFTKNCQWLVVAVAVPVVLERALVYSSAFMQLSWSSMFAYMFTQHLYGPFLMYTIGCALGCVLVVRYRPKLVYLMFGLIKVTATAAILGVYREEFTENCFYFLCFYYVCMGVYSSVALQMIVECTPFLYTELALAVALVVELLVLEVLKYETKADDSWAELLGFGIAAMVLTVGCMVLVQLYLPESEGLIEVRNRLLGIRRQLPANSKPKGWKSNYYLHRELHPNEVKCIKLEGNRIFQQYPKEPERKT